MSKLFEKSGLEGTPSLKMDGKKIEIKMAPEEFTAAVDKAIAG